MSLLMIWCFDIVMKWIGFVGYLWQSYWQKQRFWVCDYVHCSGSWGRSSTVQWLCKEITPLLCFVVYRVSLYVYVLVLWLVFNNVIWCLRFLFFSCFMNCCFSCYLYDCSCLSFGDLSWWDSRWAFVSLQYRLVVCILQFDLLDFVHCGCFC